MKQAQLSPSPQESAHESGSFRWAARFGASAVLIGILLGAFGTHGLKSSISKENLEIFTTGTQYQLINGVGLLAIAGILDRLSMRWSAIGIRLIVLGIVVFCVSLYLIAVLDNRKIGMVAPLGGLSLMLGWTALLVAIVKGRD